MQADNYFNYKRVQTKWQEDPACFYFKVALPGLTDSEVDLKVDDSQSNPAHPIVSINADAQGSSNPYMATFPVPVSSIKVDQIVAWMVNGVLVIKFPKQIVLRAQAARAIPIKSRL
ncbi:hypothetical protein DSO57_1000555 [Entomophthora muscae]|uniref:Uncharacterized protein n=1 Tax=Entomophthora muscae TaxID=34485 RepID=A0ACC2SBF5_9FUNG|nr:hypothetical protein DSO57_1000555 [Entomophthora muscae]